MHAVCNGDETQAQTLIDAIYASAAPLRFPTLSELAANLEPVTWLWENWVPKGMLTMLGAYQGTGKSYLTMDLARIVLHGSTWPDGQPTQHDAAGARGLCRCGGHTTGQQRARHGDGRGRKRMYLLLRLTWANCSIWTRQVWRDRLLDLCYTVSPALVIIDSLNAVTSTGTKSVEDVNALMSFLAGVARYFDTSLVLVHHLRKPGGGQLMLPGISIHDFMGSAHITAMMRSVIGMSVVQQKGRQFSLNGPRRVEVVKTNLTPTYPPALAVTLEQPSPGAVRFSYAPVEADDTGADEQTPEEWLVKYLEENGPTAFGDLVDDAEQENISKTALHRARKRLGGRIVDSGKRQSQGNQWMLVEQRESAADSDADDE